MVDSNSPSPGSLSQLTYMILYHSKFQGHDCHPSMYSRSQWPLVMPFPLHSYGKHAIKILENQFFRPSELVYFLSVTHAPSVAAIPRWTDVKLTNRCLYLSPVDAIVSVLNLKTVPVSLESIRCQGLPFIHGNPEHEEVDHEQSRARFQ